MVTGMRKRITIFIPLTILFALLLSALVDLRLREYAFRLPGGSLTIIDPALANGDLHTYPAGNFTVTLLCQLLLSSMRRAC